MNYNPKELIERLEKYSIFPFQKFTPTLGVIYKPQKSDDLYYLNTIKNRAKQYGARVDVRTCEDAFQAIQQIQSLRENSSINGIIIIGDFGKDANQGLADSIPVRLDLDCMAGDTYGSLFTSTSPVGFRLGPCTSVACFKILEDIYDTHDFSDMNILILGRSIRVGRPLAEILCKYNGTVTVAHSRSDIVDFAGYDIVISAIGKPKIWTEKYFSNDNDTFIDVGTNVDENNKICGDMDLSIFDDDNNVVTVQSPGGVGKVTTTILFAKLFYNCALMNGEII